MYFGLKLILLFLGDFAMDDLGRMFDPSPHGSQGTNAYVFTFIQPTKSQKITYREQQAIFYINDFNFNLIGLKLWKKNICL